MSDLWHKLHDNLVTLVRQLDVNEEGKGNRLYDTVFDRAIELVSMLGTCNVTKDSQMEAMRRKLEDAFYGLNLDQIKNSPPRWVTYAPYLCKVTWVVVNHLHCTH